MRKLGLILLTAIVVSLTSCAKDSVGTEVPNKDGEITLTLAVPGKFEAGLTRAQLPDVDENAIYSVTVVVFAKDGLYQYTKKSTSISTSGNNVNVKVNLRADGEAYDLLVLANFDEMMTFDRTLSEEGATIDTYYKTKFMYLMSRKGWGSEIESYDGFIMSGIKKNVILNPSVSSIGTISLLRSLASVDIGLNWNKATKKWDGLDNFELEEVYIYNANSHYTVMPKITTYQNNTYSKVIKPTIYSFMSYEPWGQEGEYSSMGNTAAHAVHYDASNITVGGTSLNNSGDGQNISSKIYITEVENIATTLEERRPALIVKGIFNNNEYYYRLDFVTKDGNGLDIPISVLRNHKYRFSITKVQGPGHKDPDDAFKSKSFNIVAVVEDWDEYAMNNTESNGQYYVQYSERELHFTQFGTPITSNVITLKTNQSSLTFGDLTDVAKGDGDGTWNESPTGTWTNGHFTAVFAKGPTFDDETTYTITVTAKPTNQGDLGREATARVKGSIISTGVRFVQGKHNEYRLSTLPDPANAIKLNGESQRVKIDISSSHDYSIVFDDSNAPAMFGGVWTAKSGGTLLTDGSGIDDGENGPKPIDKSNSVVWIDVSYHESKMSRVANLEIKHITPLSDAPAVLYTFVQAQEYLSAEFIPDNTSSTTLRRTGGVAKIMVSSNLTKWVISEFKVNGVDIPQSLWWGKYFTRIFGSGTSIVNLTLGENATGEYQVYTIRFKDDNSSRMSQELTLTHSRKIYGGVPAEVDVLGVTEDGELTLDGWSAEKPAYVVLFKWGSLIGLSTDKNHSLFNSSTVDDVVNFVPKEFTGNRTYWSQWSDVPYLDNNKFLLSNYLDNTIDDAELTLGNIKGSKNNKTQGIGDPCALGVIKNGVKVPEQTYRMPTANYHISGSVLGQKIIFENLGANSSDGRSLSSFSWEENNSVGTGIFTLTGSAVRTYNTSVMKLPAAGFRTEVLNGSLHNSSTSGMYWTSTSKKSTGSGAYFMGFINNQIDPLYSSNASNAMAIRCVRKQTYSGMRAVPDMLGVTEQGELTLDGWSAEKPAYAVFFKWGSLIGVTSDQAAYPYNPYVDDPATIREMILYTPLFYGQNLENWTHWDQIPYLNGSQNVEKNGGTSYLDSEYLVGGKITNAKRNLFTGIGDPCTLRVIKNGKRSAAGAYRMPTGFPFENLSASSAGDSFAYGSGNEGNGGNVIKAEWLKNGENATNPGVAIFTLKGAAATMYGSTMTLTAMGWRQANGYSGPERAGNNARYWTSSRNPNKAQEGGALTVENNGYRINTSGSMEGADAFSIRCVNK